MTDETTDDDDPVTPDELPTRTEGTILPGVSLSDSPTGHGPTDGPSLPGYRVLGKLGQGGMGVVWRAYQESTRREVALKTTTALAGSSDRTARRFEREIELAARLEHPHIARVYDSGRHQGIHYYAMELVDGLPLDRFVKKHELGREALLQLMHDIAQAVQHAHQRGIIHRDLKPSNILVTTDAEGKPKPILLDFGLAKLIDLEQQEADRTEMTQQGQVAGTLAYMAPEQAAGQIDKLDTRTDIYALGVILYQLLTGRLPRDVSGPALDALKRIADNQIDRPRMPRDASTTMVDVELESLLLKCLEQEPDERYASAAALADDIEHYLRFEPLSARPATTGYFLRKRIRKHRKPLAIAGSVALVLLFAGLFGVYRLYSQSVYLPIDSTPGGANISVNGVPRPGCGKTPCGVFLGPGEHTIELNHPDQYWTQPRIVRIRWGKVSADAYEPIVMRPAFRTFLFTSDPKGARVELRHPDTGEVKHHGQTPVTMTIPRGKYRLYVISEQFQTPDPGESVEVLGNATPLTVHRDKDNFDPAKVQERLYD